MDVRCEKCLTVYDFDETQVTPFGVTVKCTQCGNLFKVKRKDTVETPAPAPQLAPPPSPAPPSQPPPRLRTAPYAPQPLPPAQPPVPAPGSAGLGTGTLPMAPMPSPPPPRGQYVVRTALTGEVFRLDDLSQLKQWILDRKLTREDFISTDGASFIKLGSVPEVQPIFAQVAVPDVPPELATTAPMGRPDLGPSGPVTLGDTSIIDDATGPTAPKPRLTPAQLSLPPMDDELGDLDTPPRTRRWPLVMFLLLAALAGGGGYLWHERPDLWKRLTSLGAPTGGGRAQKSLADGRDQQALDTDDGFRQAQAAYLEAHGADGEDAKPLAALAETDATWAWYLRDDARLLDAQGPQASAVAQTLRKEAQGHLDDAKRYAQDALALDAEAPEVNRAMADFLRVDGAPAAEAERYLKRALDKRPDDAEATYVAGALALREGKLDDARTKLDQSLQLARAAARPLLRALYLQAKVAAAQNRPADARKLLDELLKVNPAHDRAKALLATLQAAPQAAPDAAAAPSASAAPTVAAPSPTPPVAAPSPAPSAKPQPVDDKQPRSYDELVARADKLSESGRTSDARKLYEKALEANPRGAEAYTGLGYCDLDKERFLSAVDRFKQALEIAPDYGDAIIGIAESYKIQGQKSRAAEYYKRYLKVLPHGPKAEMAQKNVHELEQGRSSGSESGEEPAKGKTEDTGEGAALPHLPKPPSGDDQPPPP